MRIYLLVLVCLVLAGCEASDEYRIEPREDTTLLNFKFNCDSEDVEEEEATVMVYDDPQGNIEVEHFELLGLDCNPEFSGTTLGCGGDGTEEHLAGHLYCVAFSRIHLGGELQASICTYPHSQAMLSYDTITKDHGKCLEGYCGPGACAVMSTYGAWCVLTENIPSICGPWGTFPCVDGVTTFKCDYPAKEWPQWFMDIYPLEPDCGQYWDPETATFNNPS